MSDSDRPRICGDACHQARRRQCHCFCLGIFHGWRGKTARDRLIAELGTDDALDIMQREDNFFEAAPPWLVQLWQQAEKEHNHD